MSCVTPASSHFCRGSLPGGRTGSRWRDNLQHVSRFRHEPSFIKRLDGLPLVQSVNVLAESLPVDRNGMDLVLLVNGIQLLDKLHLFSAFRKVLSSMR